MVLATLMRKFFAILAAVITGGISKVSVAAPQVLKQYALRTNPSTACFYPFDLRNHPSFLSVQVSPEVPTVLYYLIHILALITQFQ